MDQNNLHSDFEKFVRKELEAVDKSPSDGLWEKIAAQQQPQNFRLKVRYYRRYAAAIAAVFLLVTGYLWWGSATKSNNLTAYDAGNRSFIDAFFSPANTEPILLLPEKSPVSTDIAQLPLKEPVKHVNSFPSWYRQDNVPVDRIRFIAGEGMRYQSPISGNTVSIAANSLVYADGSPVQGEVDLFFREYRSVPDILASNLPMHYSDERGNFSFNSGGMFDIRVSQNNEELFIAPGLAYNIDFTANNNLSKASLFYFNENRTKWEYVSDRAFEEDGKGIASFDMRNRNVEARSPLPPISTESAVATENKRSNQIDPCLPVLPVYPAEANSVEWVKEAVQLGHDIAYGKRTIPAWFRTNPSGNNAYFATALDRSEIRLIFAKDKGTRFFPQDINGFFTEFDAFKNYYFLRTSDTLTAIQQEQGNNSVDAVFNNTAVWNNVEINQDKGDKCTILLIQPNGAIRIHAQLRSSTEDGKDVHFNPDAVFARYEQLRAERLSGMSKDLEEFRRFMVVSPMFQPDNEWCFSKREWLKYFSEHLPLMQARYDALIAKGMTTNDAAIKDALDEWAYRSRNIIFERYAKSASKLNTGAKLASLLQLTGFGVYNCDQIYRIASSANMINVNFRTAEGEMLDIAALRILDPATRMFFTMDNPKKLYAFPGRNLEIMATDKNGRVFYFPGPSYAQLNFKNRTGVLLTMTEITNRVQSPMGWAEVLQL